MWIGHLMALSIVACITALMNFTKACIVKGIVTLSFLARWLKAKHALFLSSDISCKDSIQGI